MLNDNSKIQSQDESKIQGVPAKQVLYQRASKYAPKAILKLGKLLDSNNESVVLGAAKTLLAKAIPDLKAMEITGKDGEQLIQFGFLKDFVSAGGWNVPTPNRSLEGSNTVQSTDMAQTSQENNDSSGKDQPGGA